MIRPRTPSSTTPPDGPARSRSARRLVLTPRDMRLAYLPARSTPRRRSPRPRGGLPVHGARQPRGGRHQRHGRPGLGRVGPLAAKPVQEGMAVLFKRLADIDVFDLEIDATEPEAFVETIRRLEPTFGAINLKDIAAPRGARNLRPPRGDASYPGLSREPLQLRRRGGRGAADALDLVDKRMDAGPSGAVRRRDRWDRLRAPPPRPRRARRRASSCTT